MNFIRLTTTEQLAQYMEVLTTAIHKALKRTGMHGTSPEFLMRSIVNHVGSPDTFLLIGQDAKGFAGVLYAYYLPTVPPYVEIPIVYTRPGCGVAWKDTVFKMLREWGKEKGAEWILSVVIRDYKKFFEWFHKPLGFKVVGILVRAPVEEEHADPLAS
jgi:hypothetical protein